MFKVCWKGKPVMSRLAPIFRIYRLAKEGGSLQPTHLSLYLALFWSWRESVYEEYFTVNRKDLM
jgi:hypothetical protein